MQDIQFIDANINDYEDIPSSLYPVLSDVSVSAVTINHLSYVVSGGVLPNATGVFFKWAYPAADNNFIRVAVGYQLQVMRGAFSKDEAQSPLPSGTLIFEEISNFKTAVLPDDRYVNLQFGASGRVDLPSGLLFEGEKYTVRIRALVFSELGDGTLSDQYFKYTEWNVGNFSVNTAPRAINLRVNQLINPAALQAAKPVKFSFTFEDLDGPAFFYQIQVGTVPGASFTASIWDSGLIAGGNGFGKRDFTLPYSGPELEGGVSYAWRVKVQDGITDGGWTDANSTFELNTLPIVSSIRINDSEMLFDEIPVVADTNGVLTWEFHDPEDAGQRAYSLRVSQIVQSPGATETQLFDIVNTGDVFSAATTVNLPDLPQDSEFSVKLRVRDAIEFGSEFEGRFKVNARPEVQNLKVAGSINPGNVSTTSPSISWTFFDNTAGDIQAKFRVQVATNDSFTSLVWDSGDISSVANSVTYGTTASPVVAPVVLTHGAYYFVRVRVSDGISFSDYISSFFSINTAPGSPTLLSPSAGAFSGPITVSWLPASPLDADGDTIFYTIELTSRRSSNQDWTYFAGPFASSVTTFTLDTSDIKAGMDYGVRVLANDGFTDSSPVLGTSPLNASGLGFTIMNHAPNTPIFISPLEDAIVSGHLKAEWLEMFPIDVDGDSVFYLLELTRASSATEPTYETIGVFNEGSTKIFIDISNLSDGSDYKLRITAQDDKGGIGETNYSPAFAISNSTAITDFESLGDTRFVGTSDGRIFKAVETIWDVDYDFSPRASKGLEWFNVFSSGSPNVNIEDGRMSINSPPGSSFMLRVAPNITSKPK